MSPAAVKAKNITEEMRAIDWSVIDRIRTGGGTGLRHSMADQMEQRMYEQQMRSWKRSDALEAKRDELEIKKMEKQLAAPPGLVMGPGGVVQSGAEQEFEKMLRTPDFLAQWNSMTPEARQSYFMMVQQMQMHLYNPLLRQQGQLNIAELCRRVDSLERGHRIGGSGREGIESIMQG